MEYRQGAASLEKRLPHLEGHRYPPCKYEIPYKYFKKHGSTVIKSRTPIIKALLQSRDRVALSATTGSERVRMVGSPL